MTQWSWVIEHVPCLAVTWSPMSMQAGSRLQAAWLQAPPSSRLQTQPYCIPLLPLLCKGERSQQSQKLVELELKASLKLAHWPNILRSQFLHFNELTISDPFLCPQGPLGLTLINFLSMPKFWTNANQLWFITIEPQQTKFKAKNIRYQWEGDSVYNHIGE